ncbi:MAG: redoxin domain-containing protein, partial [Chloroflexota bacterium]|nr:redoxin domain-containing protein [Chloroflexota bacterium]
MLYRYPHFRRQILLDDLAFRGGPPPGRPMPDFELITTEGGRIRRRDFVGRRPLLLTCASVTCPMAVEAGPALRRLHAAFGEHVAFVTLYVREAHPGEHYPQPDTFAQKVAHARAYRDLLGLPWPVAVDTLDGDLHRALDPRPNAAYLMAADGTVAFRALASNAERVLRAGLAALVTGA